MEQHASDVPDVTKCEEAFREFYECLRAEFPRSYSLPRRILENLATPATRATLEERCVLADPGDPRMSCPAPSALCWCGVPLAAARFKPLVVSPGRVERPCASLGVWGSIR